MSTSLLGRRRRASRFPPGSDLEIPTLAIEELAAGKLTALLHRSVARDAFDAASLRGKAHDPGGVSEAPSRLAVC